MKVFYSMTNRGVTVKHYCHIVEYLPGQRVTVYEFNKQIRAIHHMSCLSVEISS